MLCLYFVKAVQREQTDWLHRCQCRFPDNKRTNALTLPSQSVSCPGHSCHVCMGRGVEWRVEMSQEGDIPLYSRAGEKEKENWISLRQTNNNIQTNPNTHTYRNTHKHIHAYTHTQLHTHMHTTTHAHTHIGTYMHIETHIRLQTNI